MALYSPSEESKIVEYILLKDEMHRVKGDALWQEISELKIVNRTWQSLKQRFKKHIILNIRHPRFGLTREDQDKFLFCFHRMDTSRAKTTKRKRLEQSRNGSDSSDSDREEIERRQARARMRKAQNLADNDDYIPIKTEVVDEVEENKVLQHAAEVAVKNENTNTQVDIKIETSDEIVVEDVKVETRDDAVKLDLDETFIDDDVLIHQPIEEPVH